MCETFMCMCVSVGVFILTLINRSAAVIYSRHHTEHLSSVKKLPCVYVWMCLCVCIYVCIYAEHFKGQSGHVLINQTQCWVYCRGNSITRVSAGLQHYYGVRGFKGNTLLVHITIFSIHKDLWIIYITVSPSVTHRTYHLKDMKDFVLSCTLHLFNILHT